MPALQNLTVNDRAATPVAHTFTPRSLSRDNVATLVESGTTPIGDKKVTLQSRFTGTRYKATVTTVVPVVVNETINGIVVPKVMRTAYITTTTSFAPESSEQERNDAIGMHQNAFNVANVVVHNAVVKLEGFY